MATFPSPRLEREELVVTAGVRIPLREFDFEFMRSSGPGGQNVNKVNTKVRLRWSVAGSSSITESLRERIQDKYRRRITVEGEFLVTSQRFRDQERNRADCLEKLAGLIRDVAVARRTRRPTRPTRASKERRLDQKRRRSRRKQLRRSPGDQE
ncbi:MAG: aminoacyl-tRNA hydrolase [Planctomycetaceae bacterium]|nr:aminoacyl-tRNA hydrolase [Planctomycetaceae bacterium]MDP7275391.1 alternative ribosome rescue aminoacyl-tRNA hydrolase ArfB [Planctomycetaceae bacterium]